MLAVAFTGQDGTGKSTQIALLRERLLAEGRRVEVVHQYGPIGVVGRGVSPWAKRAANRFMRGAARPGAFSRAVGWVAASASLLAGWRRSRHNVRRGRDCDVLILDRFFSDELIRAAHKFGRVPALGWWLLRHGVPAPDLVFTFSVEECAGWERKKTRELTFEEYARKTAVVRETLREAGRTWEIVTIAIDDLTPAEVFERVRKRVEGVLESRG